MTKITAYGIGFQLNSLEEVSVTFPETLTTDLDRVNKLINYLEDRVSRRPIPECWEDDHETYFICDVIVEVPDVLSSK